MKKVDLKREIKIILRKNDQLGLIGLKRELSGKGIQFSNEELSDVVASMFLDGKLLLTYWY